MKSLHESSSTRILFALLCACALSSCATEPTTTVGNTITVSAGQKFDIRLQNVGPDVFGAPPAITPVMTPRVQYLSVEDVGPFVPAGVTQLFHFKALSAGQAVIRFESSGAGLSRAVEDTVVVH